MLTGTWCLPVERCDDYDGWEVGEGCTVYTPAEYVEGDLDGARNRGPELSGQQSKRSALG
jgi:hypothetical protein